MDVDSASTLALADATGFARSNWETENAARDAPTTAEILVNEFNQNKFEEMISQD